MNHQDTTQTLAESFNALADEVQNLSDRKTVLEHKLRYAHEQYQYLADRYASGAPEISETLANLQLPPDVHSPTLATFVPLPKRGPSDSKHQIAVLIKEGRRAAASLTDLSKSSRSSRASASPTTMTSMSTVLEQDFTVEGKRSSLKCPFSKIPEEPEDHSNSHKSGPHESGDPICATLHPDSASQQQSANGTSAAKCPIRFIDQHSPEEIAQYVEAHKHQLPRSHEVCVRRYQRNEDDIRKLDAKYGNLVSMVSGLTKIHAPMLPEQDTRPQSEVEQLSDGRVQSWAQDVSATVAEDPDQLSNPEAEEEEDGDRQSHFDRPLKEVRVGESPSRPWGISVPVFDAPDLHDQPVDRPESPPAAPMHIPSSPRSPAAPTPKKTGKCPFDHTKFAGMAGMSPHGPKGEANIHPRQEPVLDPEPPETPVHHTHHPQPQPTPTQHVSPPPTPKPALLNVPQASTNPHNSSGAPQMVFTGPVFIGYPIEQAIQFMQHFQRQ